MPDADLVRRVEMLEKHVESLQQLPSEVRALTRRVGHVESQLLQLGTEMRREFSAVRRQMATKSDLAVLRREMATKADLHGALAAAATSLRAEFREDVAGMGRDLAAVILAFQRENKVLFEDVLSRLNVIQPA